MTIVLTTDTLFIFMNWLTKYVLRKICKRVVCQGNHKKDITQYYAILKQEAIEMFPEDNEVTLQSFLEECHKNS